nr:pentatricopeptide repeat-containing protein At3g29230-like [Coffea arabica]
MMSALPEKYRLQYFTKIAKIAVNLAPKLPHVLLQEKFVSLLKSCKKARQVKAIQTQIITHALDPSNQYTIPTLLSKCFVINQVSYAHTVFDGIHSRNASVYNAMFKGYLDYEMLNEVILLFNDMIRENVSPNGYTFPMVLKSCLRLMALKEGEMVHSLVLKFGFKSNTYVGSTLIEMYARAGQVSCACRVFAEMVLRNVVTWTSMINGFVLNGDLVSARRLFDLAPERDVVLWNTMLLGYIEHVDMAEARKLFDVMPNKDLMSWNTMLNGYANNGDVERCEELFEEMPQRNIFSWNGLIGGYAHNGRFVEVLGTFKRMLNESDVQPTDATLVNVLSACARLGALDLGKWVHVYAESTGYKDNLYVCNGLIDLYAKCGMIESAINVFRNMGRKDLISWNTIINGLAVHGHGAYALKLFSEMKLEGEKPDAITFIGILCACSHMGLVDEGFQYFQSMVDEYSIAPQIVHYGCIVDLLGRAGLLEQAVDFVNKMPVKADAVIWTTLLGACRVHKNVEIAELALQKLIQIEPRNPSNYVMLGNIYRAAKIWKDVARLKVAERDTGSRKLPGCSSVEVEDGVVEFYSFDERHSSSEEIYDALRGLMNVLLSDGYVPDFVELGQGI